MFKDVQLADSLQSAKYVIQNARRFDSLVFRKGFVEDTSFTDDEKKHILSYLKENVDRSDPLFIKAKDCIDQSEMSSDYFHNYLRKFRGAYYPVVMQFIAGLMTNSLVHYNSLE